MHAEKTCKYKGEGCNKNRMDGTDCMNHIFYSTEASEFLNKIFDEGTSSFYRICK
jgi:hypothetical protein